MAVTVHCAVCSKAFRTYPSKLATGRGKYCSRTCSDGVTLLKPGHSVGEVTRFGKVRPHNYKGWRYTCAGGNRKKYIETYCPDHPNATKAGYVRAHRLVMEKQLGRYLEPWEVVDHINGDTLNNDPSNLRVMSKTDHDRMNVKLNIHRRWYAGTSARLHAE